MMRRASRPNTLVTGSAGFVGSHVVERLLSIGHAVYCIDSFAPNYNPAIKKATQSALNAKGAQFLQCDLTNGPDLGLADANFDFVIHIAAQPGLSYHDTLETYISNNVQGTNNLLDYISSIRSIKLFVYVSTSSVYGRHAVGSEDALPNPISAYGITKYIGEQNSFMAGTNRGFRVCSLRLFSVYGPRERPEKLVPQLFNAAHTGEPFYLHKGSDGHIRSFTYITDVVDAFGLALDHYTKIAGEVINIGAPETYPVSVIIKKVEAITRKSINIKTQTERDGDQTETRANVNKAKSVLGYESRVAIEDGLRLAWKEYLSSH